MTIKMIAALAAFLLIATTSANAKPSNYQPCDVYCGLGLNIKFEGHQSKKHHRHTAKKTPRKSKITVTRKLKIAKLVQIAQEPEKSTSGLVKEAERYIGMNARQVGVRLTLWCSAFIRKLAKTPGVDDRAISWIKRPHIKAAIGAIAYMRRNGGTGHVGIVAGFVKNGVVLISGNHGHRVAKSVYPKSRILAYVRA